ncbi:MAG: hypothetical protein M1457_08720 [bacterium]|nr:hypothetical protein [bacterium]
MAALIELLLSLIDLVKAEVRQSKLNAVRFVSGLILIVVAAGFLALAVALGLTSLFLYLYQLARWPAAGAALLTGALTLAVALLILAIGVHRARK